jgi:hypothetical protein
MRWSWQEYDFADPDVLEDEDIEDILARVDDAHIMGI